MAANLWARYAENPQGFLFDDRSVKEEVLEILAKEVFHCII